MTKIVTLNIRDLTLQCNVIVTTTSATSAVIYADEVQSGTLIISVGADAANKIEIDPAVFKKANLVIADSKSQCCQVGNIFHALQARTMTENLIVELGDVITENNNKQYEQQLVIANLTGVIVQDIQVANLVYQALLNKEEVNDTLS